MSEEHTKTTVEIISAYVTNNHIRAEELVGLIKDVHDKLIALANGTAEPQAEAKPEPLMPIKKTVTSGYLISLEDGKRYKTLKRHLSKRGLTPDDYRAKWSLPADYPMVARDYAERRSVLAKSLGLGRKANSADPSDPAQAIADDLIEVIAEDVIGVQVTAEVVPTKEAAVPVEETSPKKAERRVTPHPKPKDRAKPKKASEQAA